MKTLKLAPEPWTTQEGSAVVAIKDARGEIICWLNKKHPQLQGNTNLLLGAALLAVTVYGYMLGQQTKEALGGCWKKVRCVE